MVPLPNFPRGKQVHVPSFGGRQGRRTGGEGVEGWVTTIFRLFYATDSTKKMPL